MVTKNNPLLKQLETEKFRHAVAYVNNSATSIKHLTSSELAHLNQMMTSAEEPWRFEQVQITLPGGETHLFNVISNPIARAREIIGDALQVAANQNITEAALHLYSHLVLEHLFRDANRRTAVLATLWLVRSVGRDIDPEVLAKVPVGNLRKALEADALKQKIAELIR